MNEYLNNLPYWESLSEAQKKTVSASAAVRRYPKGSILMGSEDCESCFGMICVLSGEVRASILSFEGREVTLFRIRQGDCCVLSASCVVSQLQFDTQMTVSEDAEILIVPSSVFGRLTEENIYVKCFLYELATERFSTVMSVVQQLLFASFDQRLATYLVEEYHKTGSRELHLTQEQIAQNVNSAREVVARMLKQFANSGILEYRRGLLVLKDIPALENFITK